MKPRHLAIPACVFAASLVVWFSIRPAPVPSVAPAAASLPSTENYPPPVTGVAPLPAAKTPEAPRVAVRELASSPPRPTSVGPPPPSPVPILVIPPGSGATDKSHSREEIRTDLDRVKLMLQQYRSTLGENPVGTNAEIMKSLMGGNPRKIMIQPDGEDGTKLNGDGELIDRYGRPYFFHQISGQEMEIRSAGADGKMWTNDDVIVK